MTAYLQKDADDAAQQCQRRGMPVTLLEGQAAQSATGTSRYKAILREFERRRRPAARLCSRTCQGFYHGRSESAHRHAGDQALAQSASAFLWGTRAGS